MAVVLTSFTLERPAPLLLLACTVCCVAQPAPVSNAKLVVVPSKSVLKLCHSLGRYVKCLGLGL